MYKVGSEKRTHVSALKKYSSAKRSFSIIYSLFFIIYYLSYFLSSSAMVEADLKGLPSPVKKRLNIS